MELISSTQQNFQRTTLSKALTGRVIYSNGKRQECCFVWDAAFLLSFTLQDDSVDIVQGQACHEISQLTEEAVFPKSRGVAYDKKWF